MLHVIFATPLFNELAIRFIRVLGSLQEVQLGVISQEPQEILDPGVQAHITAHWQVGNALDVGQLVWAVESLKTQLGPIHRLLAINEQIQIPVAEVRERLDIEGTLVEVARNFREKDRMKSLLREAGLPCARHRLAIIEREAWEFVEEVGYPIVLKPPAGAGSQATYRVESAEDLSQVLTLNPPNPIYPTFLEEFITGEEYSYETFSLNGNALWHSWTHYIPQPLNVMRIPWIQWRVVLPREMDDPKIDAINKVAIQALGVLGMDTGLSHLEWFQRRDGSVVISEVGMRPPGAQIMTLMSRAHDFDCVTAWAKLMVFGEFVPPKRKFSAGAAYLRGHGQGRVTAIRGFEAIQQKYGNLITDMKLPYVGQEKSMSYEGEGYIIVRHPETAVVEGALFEIVKTVQVDIG